MLSERADLYPAVFSGTEGLPMSDSAFSKDNRWLLPEGVDELLPPGPPRWRPCAGNCWTSSVPGATSW